MSQTSENKNTTTPAMQPKVRFNDISILRISAMLMVVFYHCLCPYSIWDGTDYFIGFHVPAWDVVDGMLAQIHLPIFFLISGFLFGYKRIRGGYSDNIEFAKNKVMRVLLPYVIVGLFLCFLQDRDIGQMLDGISHLWFLLTIFECYVLGKALSVVIRMKKLHRQMMIVVLMLFIILVPYRLPEVRFLCLSRLVAYFPYYMTGMLICNMDFGALAKYKNLLLLIGVLLVVLFAVQQVYFNKRPITMFWGVAIVALTFTYARLLNIPKLPSWVVSLDKCSMGIYIVHHIVIQEMNGVVLIHGYACEYYYLSHLLQFVAVTILSWLFVAICRRCEYSKYILG